MFKSFAHFELGCLSHYGGFVFFLAPYTQNVGPEVGGASLGRGWFSSLKRHLPGLALEDERGQGPTQDKRTERILRHKTSRHVLGPRGRRPS